MFYISKLSKYLKSAFVRAAEKFKSGADLLGTFILENIRKTGVKHRISEADGLNYGAAELKRNYQKLFAKGFIVALAVHLFVIFGYIFAGYISSEAESNPDEQKTTRIVTVKLSDLAPPPSIQEEEEILPPPKLEKKIEEPQKDLKSLEPEPVKREQAEEQTIKTQKELEEMKTPVSDEGDTVSYNYSGPIKVEEKKIEEKLEKEETVTRKPEKTIYQSYEVEKPPEAVNLSQVSGMMVYPEVARQAGIEGRVTVKVLVGTDGSVIRVGKITGPDVFHSEVRDKVAYLQFTPGLQNGKPVKVWVHVPFNFKLK